MTWTTEPKRMRGWGDVAADAAAVLAFGLLLVCAAAVGAL